MIECPRCHGFYATLNLLCPECSYVPQEIDGFVSWSPEKAHSGDGFNPESFEGLEQDEEGHFWFVARNKIIRWVLGKFFSGFKSLIEVGCGTGFVLRDIKSEFPEAQLSGSEIFIEGLNIAKSRLPDVNLMQMDARKIPYVDEFDVVAAFDVLEHITEDSVAVRGLFKAVCPGGGLLVTVPQHGWLWSVTDDLACHKRRYSGRQIYSLLEGAGFEVVFSTSFVTLLLPLMLLSRLRMRSAPESGVAAQSEFQLPVVLNRVLSWVMTLEFFFIRLGLRFPVGGSRLVVARKPEQVSTHTDWS